MNSISICLKKNYSFKLLFIAPNNQKAGKVQFVSSLYVELTTHPPSSFIFPSCETVRYGFRFIHLSIHIQFQTLNLSVTNPLLYFSLILLLGIHFGVLFPLSRYVDAKFFSSVIISFFAALRETCWMLAWRFVELQNVPLDLWFLTGCWITLVGVDFPVSLPIEHLLLKTFNMEVQFLTFTMLILLFIRDLVCWEDLVSKPPPGRIRWVS